ncbi:hypothetical protein [Pseudoduganella umbonata]|uniref:Monoheme cytochrome SoxX n=1 Tax=Pseudoduganella umbonata TaxID=864828 RepID=A0A4P8HMX7_9BURK|nr:hypothetical protein [Pseudoduganella umbonata]MBB3219647.1 hypothetical protein [Pseudoduganella umbonata]QCP09708.1 hypothetical protein FCL38_04185 [Pseudoduganella umbonata]
MLAKQLFYLTSDQLHAWQWQRNTLFGPHIFPATRAGLNDFLAYLDRHGNRPGYLLTDLIEEDYTRLLLPHVRGRGGRKLRERRLVQHYRDTPYRATLVQGRSEEGRRDDEVLFTALTNPLLLTPWVDAMELMQTPLAGIYSCAMLGRDVLQRLALRHRHVLLVSWHTAGLRQTYFLRGNVKFSRLVQATPEEAPIHAVALQTARTQQFLGSVRLLARGDVLHVLVLAAADQVERLAAECTSTAETIYHIVPLDTAAAALHAGTAAPGATRENAPVAAHVAEPTLLAMVARNPPASHYPTGAAGNYYRLLQARLSLYASSAVLATAGVVWSVLNLASYTLAHGTAEAYRSEIAHYRANYDRSMSSMPPAADKTANMRAAVSIDRMVAKQGPWPVAMMRMVSGALEQSPQIRVVQLDWRANVPGAASGPAPGGTAATPALAAPTSSLALGIPKSPPQTLRLEAEVLSARNDYRRVLGEMNVFAQRLAGMPNMTVEIVQLPFDIRPTQKLSGTVGAPAAGQEQNKFTLDMTWTP